MENDIEKFRYGSFGPLPEEIEKVRKEAKEKGKNPDIAEKELKERMMRATGRTQEHAGEKARKKLEDSFGREKS